MRITIITFGTEGDVRPMVALAEGLARAGHTPVLVADPAFAPLTEGRGIEFKPLSGDIRATTASSEMEALFTRGLNPAELSRMMARLAIDHSESWAEQFLAAARGSDAIIAIGLGFFIGLAIAEKLGIPAIGAGLQPVSPTGRFPPPLIPPPRRPLPGVVNHSLHVAMRQLVWLSFRRMVNQARRNVLGLGPWSLVHPGHVMLKRRWPVLYGFSPVVVPPPSDWPDLIKVTGYWFLDGANHWKPPAALLDFLDAGPAPVYVGFGSMGGFDPVETSRLVVRALNGRRAVLAAGWGALDRNALPDTVHFLESAPHDWLFPRMSAVVHHGGAGTTAAALRAGVPMVTVPFLGDQPFWGWRMEQLGVAPGAIPRKQLTAENLAAAIAATGRPGLRERAEQLGGLIRAEDGVARAVRIIEGMR
ncbi:glycosyltransferase [Myxococcus sp. RHSTA-1-4]|uniref:glycosyltransferase n=1 Tax=Myxococcus sp. RHSTA-1-4 TaxID=2874601 RepID=UPI001CBC028D|nr:glycosyltransferase [Myxococcus sp. RHSTA-1-4]MBZ4417377.1 glycosyltransferase [Myxococcus sp. RHSTA-1-4]